MGNGGSAQQVTALDQRESRPDGPVGLIEPGLVQHLEERSAGSGETHVTAGHRGQPVGRCPGLAHLRRDFRVEKLIGVHRDCRQQVIAVSEMGVGGTDRDAEPRLGVAVSENPRTPRSLMTSMAVPTSAALRSPW
jgi:hypothetical protein